MDEEIEGERRGGVKTETVTVGKGQQRQRASVRKEMKNRLKRWKSMSCFLWGGPALWCLGLQSGRLMMKR